MSTILNALRRLEEDGRPPAGSAEDPLSATDPRAADELRDRILAEEFAAQAVSATSPDRDRLKRIGVVAAVALLVLALGTAAYRSWPPTAAEPTPIVLAAAPPVVPQAPTPAMTKRPLPPAVRDQVVNPPEAATAENARDAQPSFIPVPAPLPNMTVLDDSNTTPATNALGSTSSATPSVARAGSEGFSAAPAIPADSSLAEAIEPSIPTAAPAILAASATSPREASQTEAALETASASAMTSSRPMPTSAPNQTPNVSAPRTTDSSISAPPRSASEPKPRTVEATPIFEASSVERLDTRGLPEIRILRTAWHPNADRRSAKIRLETSEEVMTLREGDAVGKFVIQSISPSSVLFRIGDVEIRRRVGQP